MLWLYRFLTSHSRYALQRLLQRRLKQGKEDAERLSERQGIAGRERPEGSLIWFHAASVGEAQSLLILLDMLHELAPQAQFLVTTGTLSSAQMLEKRLPEHAFHQFYPLDHPQWVAQFLDHWQPHMAVWLESELWPNMLSAMKARHIPAVLINGRLSDKSFARWRHIKDIRALLDVFVMCFAQTEEEAVKFRTLGIGNVEVIDNLKYAARPLPCDDKELKTLEEITKTRPVVLYASTHSGEEEMACRIHTALQKEAPDILSIIAPRHPERRQSIKDICSSFQLKTKMRGPARLAPASDTQIYICDTIGEMGLLYRLADIAFIGRSLSDEGGGGHNPIEAALLNAAVIHGPLIQNQARIYAEMNEAGAALKVGDERELLNKLVSLLADEKGLAVQQERGRNFVVGKAVVLETIKAGLAPMIRQALPPEQPEALHGS